MKQIKDIVIREADIDSTVMNDLRTHFLNQIMEKLAETHNDWINVFTEKMEYGVASMTLVTVLSSCLSEAIHIQGQGVDKSLGAGSTLHYQALLQARDDIDRHIEEVRPLCSVADRIDQFRKDTPAIEVCVL